MRRFALSLAALLALPAAGCNAPVAAALDEADANLVVVALEQAGIAADKTADPGSEGRWRVSVSRDDAAAALTVLSQQSLPPRPAPGVLDTLGSGSIVPSRTAEHARVIAGTAGELERSLREVDGVLTARVHLAVAPKDPLTTEDGRAGPTASVLLKHRGATPPISVTEVQKLVAGAVVGLAPSAVAVVSSPNPEPSRPTDRQLARFGPITATRASLGWARGLVGGVIALAITLAAVIVTLWTRLRRAHGRLADTRAADEQT